MQAHARLLTTPSVVDLIPWLLTECLFPTPASELATNLAAATVSVQEPATQPDTVAEEDGEDDGVSA